eukprot:3581647-Prymnesium_polylepis.1
MGSCSSKNEEVSSLPANAAATPKEVDHNTVAPAVPSDGHGHGAHAAAPAAKPLQQQVSMTKSGFHSDIQPHKDTMAAHLAHNNKRALKDVYETNEGAVLGRGACGTVAVVKRKDTGELYAMKTVSLDGMAGGTLAELRKEIDIQRQLTHPNICRLFESFEEDGVLFIIME